VGCVREACRAAPAEARCRALSVGGRQLVSQNRARRQSAVLTSSGLSSRIALVTASRPSYESVPPPFFPCPLRRSGAMAINPSPQAGR
jgi:hypothetical protein